MFDFFLLPSFNTREVKLDAAAATTLLLLFVLFVLFENDDEEVVAREVAVATVGVVDTYLSDPRAPALLLVLPAPSTRSGRANMTDLLPPLPGSRLILLLLLLLEDLEDAAPSFLFDFFFLVFLGGGIRMFQHD